MGSRFRNVLIGIFSAGLGLAASAQAQTKWSYPGCNDITDADFKYDTLIIRQKDNTFGEPAKMAFDMDAEGNVDVYFVELRPGNVKRYNAKTKTTTTLVKLPNWGMSTDYIKVKNSGNVEEGVHGIALDPNFKTNGYVYIHWSPLPITNEVFRISRFTVANNAIALSTEKVLIDIPAQRQTCCHTGGAMQFDAYGDLWITVGANSGRANSSGPLQGINEDLKYESEEWGASNTHSMRGGIIRIHPDNSAKGYSIPKDNFGEYFARTLGKPEYADTSKVAPEVYIKGSRNPYSLTIDPVRRWVAWGDVGPDRLTGLEREEINLRKTPGFEGWPYFVGQNIAFAGSGKVASAPTNTSKWNDGLGTLPPARPAFTTHGYGTPVKGLGTSPITGPYYLYDGDSKSTVKLPPHFNRKWFVTDYTSGTVAVIGVDDAGDKATGGERIFANNKFEGPIDFRQGPDGALYLMTYGAANFAANGAASIVKISYTGTCRPATPKLETPVGIAQSREDLAPRAKGILVNLGAGKALMVPAGMAGMELFDINGKQVWNSGKLKAGETFWLPKGLVFGALKYRWVPAGI